MRIGDRSLLICDCEGTIPLDDSKLRAALEAVGADAGDGLTLSTQLCRAQLERFLAAAAGEAPVLVACTQEAPLFGETAEEELGEESAEIAYVNIRERAGWSNDAEAATPKIAALIAEAALALEPVPTVSFKSDGVVLVYGRDETAIEAARQIKDRMDVTVLLAQPGEVIPPAAMDVPVLKGTITRATGHLGAFALTVDDYAPPRPSGRGYLAFEDARNGAQSECDLILDLTGGTPLFPHADKRDGYFAPDPGNPALVQKALLEITDLVGEFEKPRYVSYNPDICAHGASMKKGCTRCVDLCPAGAVASAGDKVAYDPHLCAGCGQCAAACPTGAVSSNLPGRDDLGRRLRTVLGGYRDAGGLARAGAPSVLFHDPRWGDEALTTMSRFGDGLPARVIPMAVNEVTQLGLDALLLAVAYGAASVHVLVPPSKAGETQALASQVGLAETLLSGLGYGSGRIQVIDEADPLTALEALRAGPAFEAPEPANFIVMGGNKRTAIMQGLRHLHAHAPSPVDVLPLPEGAPFGRVAVNTEGCTLCLSCVGACPTGALGDEEARPLLSFTEDACVQCGLCRATCPESVIALEPRIDFTEAARATTVIKQEDPFHCVRCGKPFGTRGSIEHIHDRLAGQHSMFLAGEAAERILMCDDCRVVVQFEVADNPMASAPRPLPRTTEDYLREREIEEARAKLLRERAEQSPDGDE